jgi:hypothetical protein
MVVGYNKNYQWKTAFASPENQPTYLHAHKLVRKTWQAIMSPLKFSPVFLKIDLLIIK